MESAVEERAELLWVPLEQLRPNSWNPNEMDAAMYAAMKRAYLAVLPAAPPGLTVEEIRTRLPARLPDDLPRSRR